MNRIVLVILAGLMAVLSVVMMRLPWDGTGAPGWRRLLAGPVLLMRDDSGSLEEAKQALARDPATPYKWCALAERLEEAGEGEAAETAINRAVELGPGLPQIRLRAANLFFLREQPDDGLPHAVRALELTRAYDGALFGLFRRLEIPVERVVSAGIAEEARVGAAYLRDAHGWASPAEVQIIWEELQKRGEIDNDLISKQISYLISHRLYREAAGTWREYVGSGEGQYGEGELLYNGGFEQEFSGSVLDWRVSRNAGAEVVREATGASEGEYGLRVRFGEKRNLVFRGVTQLTYLPPGEYLLSARVRSDGLSTDRGVYLRVFDRDASRKLYAKTEEVLETDGWERLEASFRVGSGGSMAGVQLCRDESLRIDSKIAGEVWFDEISLQPVRR